jgi:hypothetical protein
MQPAAFDSAAGEGMLVGGEGNFHEARLRKRRLSDNRWSRGCWGALALVVPTHAPSAKA